MGPLYYKLPPPCLTVYTRHVPQVYSPPALPRSDNSQVVGTTLLQRTPTVPLCYSDMHG